MDQTWADPGPASSETHKNNKIKTVKKSLPYLSSEKMNKKFGATAQPTGTPSLAKSCVVVIASLLAGASVVHNIYRPDLVIL